jgi:hypothetical protein
MMQMAMVIAALHPSYGLSPRYCERSEAIHRAAQPEGWIGMPRNNRGNTLAPFLPVTAPRPLFSPRWHFPFTPKRFMVAAGFAFSEI